MIIKNSLEWNKVETDLKRQARNLSNYRDINKMIDNIRKNIKLLSNAEIELRRGSKYKAEEILTKINEDIEMVEEYLLIATLMG